MIFANDEWLKKEISWYDKNGDRIFFRRQMWRDFLSSDFIYMGGFPLLIIIARMIDVTLGTLRIIFVSRGNRIIAPILGFLKYLSG